MTATPESLRPGLSRLLPTTPSTILESLTVIVLFVVLVSMGVRYATAAAGSAGQNAARAQIAMLAPAIEQYYVDHATFQGMTSQALGLVQGKRGARAARLEFSNLSPTGFCVQVRSGGWYAAESGMGGSIQTARHPLCP